MSVVQFSLTHSLCPPSLSQVSLERQRKQQEKTVAQQAKREQLKRLHRAQVLSHSTARALLCHIAYLTYRKSSNIGPVLYLTQEHHGPGLFWKEAKFRDRPLFLLEENRLPVEWIKTRFCVYRESSKCENQVRGDWHDQATVAMAWIR